MLDETHERHEKGQYYESEKKSELSKKLPTKDATRTETLRKSPGMAIPPDPTRPTQV